MKRAILLTLISTKIIVCHHEFLHDFELANEYFRAGRYHDARIAYDAAYTSNPLCYQALYNKGLTFACEGKLDEAIYCYESAVKADPSYLKAHLMLGQAYKQKNMLSKALSHFESSIILDNNHVDALAEAGKIAFEMNDTQKALQYLSKATALQPHNTSVLLDYANILSTNNHLDEAIRRYQTILDISPNNESALYNMAYTLKKGDNIIQALPYYHRVLEINPNNAEAHFSLSLAYLVSGNMQDGWKEYEWRWRRNGFEQRAFTQPMWLGEPLQGKILFIHAEQGLGDTLQFIRYALIAKERGATIIAAVQDVLIPLLSLCPHLDRVISLGDSLPHFDYHIPLVSMPLICKTELETIPDSIPYLYADEQLTDYWKSQLSQDLSIKIGICWQGNANYNTPFLRHAVATKSIDPKIFAPLASIPGISLYSLQRVSGTEQLKDITQLFTLHQFDEAFDNKHGRFMDTAAVMKNLDLIITIDTSICHLAGGLGVPVWLMLPKPADWRWLLDRNDTPWYPTMRLFRQEQAGNWESVITTIINELTESITYYENDSIFSRIIDQTTVLHEQCKSHHDTIIQQVFRGFAHALICRAHGNDTPHWKHIIRELEQINADIMIHDKAFRQEYPFHESYIRLSQKLFFLLHKRELVKQKINILSQEGKPHA